MGHFSLPLTQLEGNLVDSWFTLLPRKGKAEQISGKIRVQAYLKLHAASESPSVRQEKGYLQSIPPDISAMLDSSTILQQEAIFKGIAAESKYGEELAHLNRVRSHFQKMRFC